MDGLCDEFDKTVSRGGLHNHIYGVKQNKGP